MNLETSIDRYNTMAELYQRAVKINLDLRRESETEGVVFGDVISLLGQMQNLSIVDELIHTEKILEETLNDMLNAPCDSEEDRRNFIAAYGKGVHAFLKDILIGRIAVTLDMANPKVVTDKRLMKLQKDIRETMTALRERYRQLYKI